MQSEGPNRKRSAAARDAYHAVLARFVDWCEEHDLALYVELPRLLCQRMGVPYVQPEPTNERKETPRNRAAARLYRRFNALPHPGKPVMAYDAAGRHCDTWRTISLCAEALGTYRAAVRRIIDEETPLPDGRTLAYGPAAKERWKGAAA